MIGGGHAQADGSATGGSGPPKPGMIIILESQPLPNGAGWQVTAWRPPNPPGPAGPAGGEDFQVLARAVCAVVAP